MIQKREKILTLAKKFKALCEKNNIWYSLDGYSLLGAERHGGFVPWFEKFQIMITLDGFNTIKRIAPSKIIDSSKDKRHHSFLVTFTNDANDWVNTDSFLEIRVAVPTTNKKVAKYRSLLTRTKAVLTNRKDNIKHAINDLFEPKSYEGFLKIESRNQEIKKSWVQVLTLKQTEKEFNGIKFKVAIEWKSILVNMFGEDYMNSNVPNSWSEYPTPLKAVKEK